jgi:alpha-beta hydrolase superfamily lysophospholipase
MKINIFVLVFITFLFIVLGGIVAAIAFGGPKKPAPMPSINEPLKIIDYPDLPKIARFTARDGAKLSYREYPSDTSQIKGSIVLIHGSSANSISMHALAKGFAQNGYLTYALDVRGHGVSGDKGQIAYIGQLENDLEDFLQFARLVGKKTLVGFSAGGGFALRFASSSKQKMFDSYLLLSPFIHQDAPTTRTNTDNWVKVGVPRVIALTLLNLFGITTFNSLTVTTFALDEEAQTFLTPQYSYALSQNFRPRYDYRADISAVTQPLEVLVSQNDETLHAEQFSSIFRKEDKTVTVTIYPRIGHVELIQNSEAIQASISSVERLNVQQ